MVGANNTVTHGMNGLPTVPPLCKGRWLPKADGGIVLDRQHPQTPRRPYNRIAHIIKDGLLPENRLTLFL